MLEPVLVVLPLAAGGEATHLALSSPESAEDCAARAEAVRQELEDAGGGSSRPAAPRPT